MPFLIFNIKLLFTYRHTFPPLLPTLFFPIQGVPLNSLKSVVRCQTSFLIFPQLPLAASGRQLPLYDHPPSLAWAPSPHTYLQLPYVTLKPNFNLHSPTEMPRGHMPSRIAACVGCPHWAVHRPWLPVGGVPGCFWRLTITPLTCEPQLVSTHFGVVGGFTLPLFMFLMIIDNFHKISILDTPRACS